MKYLNKNRHDEIFVGLKIAGSPCTFPKGKKDTNRKIGNSCLYFPFRLFTRFIEHRWKWYRRNPIYRKSEKIIQRLNKNNFSDFPIFRFWVFCVLELSPRGCCDWRRVSCAPQTIFAHLANPPSAWYKSYLQGHSPKALLGDALQMRRSIFSWLPANSKARNSWRSEQISKSKS